MKEIKNNPYNIARSTLEFLFPFSFQVELKKNVNHDLGWWIHPVHLFYVVTNFYYFPYYVMKADIAPYPVRLVSHYECIVIKYGDYALHFQTFCGSFKHFGK